MKNLTYDSIDCPKADGEYYVHKFVIRKRGAEKKLLRNC